MGNAAHSRFAQMGEDIFPPCAIPYKTEAHMTDFIKTSCAIAFAGGVTLGVFLALEGLI